MKIQFAAALALLSAAPAFAANVTITFESAPGYVNPILEHYNGGVDSLGQSGTNFGVSFTDGAVALSNDALGPYYLNAPTNGTAMYAFDSTAVMNVANGFQDGLTFYYSSSAVTLDAVKVYSGLNATGTLLASASLYNNAQDDCTGAAFCRFTLTSVQFAGIGKSISFAGNSPNVLYDNIGFTTAVPESSTWLLLATGLLAVGVAKRRSQG